MKALTLKNKNVVQDYLESNAWLFNRKDTTKVLPIVLLDIYRDRYVFGLKNDTIHLEKFNNVRYTPASFTVSDDEIQRYVISTGVIASSITFTRLSEIASMATRQNRTVKLSTAIAIVLGLGVGYKVGYKKMPDYDNPFLKDIIEDQDFWKGVIERKVFQRKEEIAANLPGAPEPAWYEKALGWLIFW